MTCQSLYPYQQPVLTGCSTAHTGSVQSHVTSLTTCMHSWDECSRHNGRTFVEPFLGISFQNAPVLSLFLLFSHPLGCPLCVRKTQDEAETLCNWTQRHRCPWVILSTSCSRSPRRSLRHRCLVSLTWPRSLPWFFFVM